MKKRLSYLLILFLPMACRHAPAPIIKTDWSVYRKAYELIQRNPDSAFYYFNKVAISSRDSTQIALALSFMGQIQFRAGDYYGAQESHLNSLKYLNENVPAQRIYMAYNFNDLGSVRSELKDHSGALDFYKKALSLAPDSALLDQVLNNMAYEWQNTKKYNAAISLYKKLLDKIKKQDANYARALTNLATTQWMADPEYGAVVPLKEALAIRIRSGDLWGQNSSYAHLADYYRLSKPDSSLLYAKAMYHIAQGIESPDDRLEALSKLIGLTPSEESKRYFTIYKTLNDSVMTARNAAKNQFALVRYNVDQEKIKNLKLQKENADSNLRLLRQSVLLYSSIAAFLLIITSLFIWFQKRKKQQEIDKQNAVIETNQKASKKVHDTLANDTYRIMKSIQQDLVPDKEWLVFHINDLYVRTRDISYDLTETNQKEYPTRISELLKSFGDESTRILVVGNKPEFWEQINQVHKYELRYILQELMVNMQKHSRASNVTVKFQVLGEQCVITYYDNGLGLGNTHQPKNGLTNTGNRIKEIGGTITFGNDNGQGLLITIIFTATKPN